MIQLSPDCFPWSGYVDGGVEGTGDGGEGCVVGAAASGVAGDTGVEGDEEGVGVGGHGGAGCVVGAAAGGVAGIAGVEGDEAGVGVGGYLGEGNESSGSIVIPI